MSDLSDKDFTIWESICQKCGRCCYEKVDFEGHIYYTELPCEYLDQNTKLCRVYEERETARPGCVKLTAEKVTGGFLPADCPYVKDLKVYVPPETYTNEKRKRKR
jgi:uncharacterized cysteine cluster protein YcgN (CxxCxxCC family)